MRGDDQKAGPGGETESGDEGIGESDMVEIQMAALQQEITDGGLGLLEFTKRGVGLDDGGRRNATGGADAVTGRRLQMGEEPAGKPAWRNGTASLMVVEVENRLYGGAHGGDIGEVRGRQMGHALRGGPPAGNWRADEGV